MEREQRRESSQPNAMAMPSRAPVSRATTRAAGSLAVERIAREEDDHVPKRARPFPLGVFRQGDFFDSLTLAQSIEVSSKPLVDGPSVMGPFPFAMAGLQLTNPSFFVWVDAGRVVKWCPLDEVPMGATRLRDYLVWRGSSGVHVLQDRETNEARMQAAVPNASQHDIHAVSETNAELNRDREDFVARGFSPDLAIAKTRAVHEDELVELVQGVQHMIQMYEGGRAAMETAGEMEVFGRLAGKTAEAPIATAEQHSLAATPHIDRMPATEGNFAGMRRLQDIHRDPTIAPELRKQFIEDAHATLAAGKPAEDLHYELSKVAYAQPEKYLRQGEKASASRIRELGSVQRVISMKVVIGSMVTPKAYKRYAIALGGAIPTEQCDFRWQAHADHLFAGYKRGDVVFEMSDLAPEGIIQGPKPGSSAWTFSGTDAGEATSAPHLLQQQLAVSEEYAHGYLLVEISAEAAAAHGAARPTAIDLTNSPLGKLNPHEEPFGRTNPTQAGQKQVRELVLSPLSLSEVSSMRHVR